MAVQVVNNLAEGPDDIVTRQRKEHQAKVYDRGVFTTESVTIDFGPKREKVIVNLRFEIGSQFAFACYPDNTGWHERSREEWTAAATDALEKFCAARDVAIIAGPRPEITNRYNMQVEIRGHLQGKLT